MDYSELNLAIIQARLTSTRFPGKVLRKVGEYSIIEIIVKRLERSKLLDKIVIAIPDNESNVELANFLEQKNIESIGRFGAWEYYWSDQSMMSGRNAGKKILKDILNDN